MKTAPKPLGLGAASFILKNYFFASYLATRRRRRLERGLSKPNAERMAFSIHSGRSEIFNICRPIGPKTDFPLLFRTRLIS